MHPSSINIMKGFIELHMSSMRNKNISILDVGSQDVNGSYKELFCNKNWKYVGMDISPGKNVDMVVKDIYKWDNIQDENYEVVVSGQAFEHIEYFWLTMQEIYRVLKVGGLLCIIVPSTGFEHRYPKDCWRFYSDGLRAMATYVKLTIIEATVTHIDKFWNDSVLVARKDIL